MRSVSSPAKDQDFLGPCTASSALSIEPGATRIVTVHSGEGGSVRCVLGRLASCSSIGIFVRRAREAGADKLLSTWERCASFLGASAGREAIDFGRLIPASYRIDCFGVTGNRIVLGAGRCEVVLGQRSEVDFDACTGAWDVDIDLTEDLECRWLISVTGDERGMGRSRGSFAGTARFRKGVLEIRGLNAPTALVHLTAIDGADRTIGVDARSRRRY